ncbi:S8 family peptidase [Streptomyces abyssalis]|uniref:S8 family peptidase n=1 Tax=Streptomyces abyssalis TaxID=933944 RepID=UPI00099F721A|nr:S8 family serine peptidase [Streptomyces abyssalis]
MNSGRIRAAILTAGVGALLCIVPVTPAHADTPTSWESQALRLSSAQVTTQGEGVTVAVLDTGVMKNHPALAGKVTTGPNFVKDDLRPGNPRWGDHGTAMASDVLKVAPKAEILSIRVIDEKGNDFEGGNDVSGLVRGIKYALDRGADVISLSLGGGSFASGFDEEETKVLARAAGAGVPVVAGAGNDGDEFNGLSYPAAYPGVIAVAAVDKRGNRAKFSTVRTYNSVAAPGVGIVSAKNTGGYESINGTSPATALTSGVVALMLAENDKLGPAQVRSILTSNATPPRGGYNPMLGHGTINAAASVRAASNPRTDKAAPADYKGRKHFANPNGVTPTQHPPMDTAALIVGIVAACVGVLMVIGAIRVIRGRGRRGAAATAMGPSGPGGYPYPPVQVPGYGQLPYQQQPAAPPQQPPPYN